VQTDALFLLAVEFVVNAGELELEAVVISPSPGESLWDDSALIEINTGGKLTLRRCIVEKANSDSTSYRGWGALPVNGRSSAVLISNSIFRWNRGWNAAAIFAGAGVQVTASNAK